MVSIMEIITNKNTNLHLPVNALNINVPVQTNAFHCQKIVRAHMPWMSNA
jgi:hypothetical protein